MVRYAEEEVLPYPRATVWALLEKHGRNDEILRIHPDIVAQESVRESPDGYVVRRTIRFVRGRLVSSTWRITQSPPDSFGWEILDGDGPWAPGSWIKVRYEDVPGGTRVRAEGELRVLGFPGFLQGPLVRAALRRVGREDVGSLRAHP